MASKKTSATSRSKPAVKKPAKAASKAKAVPVKSAVKKPAKPVKKATPKPVKPVKKASAKAAPAAKTAAKPVARKAKPVAAPAPAKKKPAPKPAARPSKASAAPARKPAAKAAPVAKKAPATPVRVATPQPASRPAKAVAAPSPVIVSKNKSSKSPGTDAASRSKPLPALPPSLPPGKVAVAVARVPLSKDEIEKPVPKRSVKPKPGSLLTEQQIRSAPDSDYMNDDQLAFFRDLLQRQRAEVTARQSDIKERLNQHESFADPADRASAEEEYWLDLRLRERESLLLKKIDDALRRIRDREYGWCEKTGEAIGIARLLARPTATVCVDIKDQDERAESQFRDR